LKDQNDQLKEENEQLKFDVKNEDPHRPITPENAQNLLKCGKTVLAGKVINLDGGFVPVGAVGKVFKEGGSNGNGPMKIKWLMPINHGGKRTYASTAITYINWDAKEDFQNIANAEKGVRPDQLLMRYTALDPIGFKDNAENLAVRPAPFPGQAKRRQCRNWEFQCTEPHFGDEHTDSAANKTTAFYTYQKKVNVVREQANDDAGGCDFYFECVNAIPARVDADTAELIRAGVGGCGWRSSNWRVLSRNNVKFFDCFLGYSTDHFWKKNEQSLRQRYWESICNVCGYSAVQNNGFVDKPNRWLRNEWPINEAWPRKRVFAKDSKV
jgi:hypothetical protein